MRKLGLLALIAVIGGGWYLLHDVGHIPVYDAHLVRLAESPLEGYCAGTTFWTSQGQGDAESAARCRTTADYPAEKDLSKVVTWFCVGISTAGWQGTAQDCENIMYGQKMWPTYDGSISKSWSKSAPYPGELILVGPPDDSRTGGREGFVRGQESESTTTGEG